MNKPVFWLFALLLLLGGCAAPPPPVVRYVYPLPPEQPRIEWLGTYASQDDFPKTKMDLALENLAGKPPLDFFTGPYGVVDDGAGRVFVADMYQKNILVYDLNLYTIKYLLKEPVLGRPYYMAIDSRKQIYVADGENKKILVLSPEGQLLRTFGNREELVNPVNVEIDEKHHRLYVADSGAGIRVYDMESGRQLSTIGQGVLLGAQGVALGPDGNLYVADTLNAKIRTFDAEGQLLRSFGERVDQDYGFEYPKDLAFDSDGHLWIVDYRKPYVRVFSTDGQFLFSAGGPATHKMGFANPTAIYISPEDEIYVTDITARRFSHWRYLSKAALARHPLETGDSVK